jgi:hypothetical protein
VARQQPPPPAPIPARPASISGSGARVPAPAAMRRFGRVTSRSGRSPGGHGWSNHASHPERSEGGILQGMSPSHHSA